MSGRIDVAKECGMKNGTGMTVDQENHDEEWAIHALPLSYRTFGLRRAVRAGFEPGTV